MENDLLMLLILRWVYHNNPPDPNPFDRDLLAALNLRITASLVSDAGVRSELERLAIVQLRNAADQLEQQAGRELEG